MTEYPASFQAILDTLTPAGRAALLHTTADQSYEELENFKIESLPAGMSDIKTHFSPVDTEIYNPFSYNEMLSGIDFFERNSTREEVADLPLEDGVLSIEDALMSGMQIYTIPKKSRVLTKDETQNLNEAQARQAAIYRSGLDEINSPAADDLERGTRSIADWIAATDYDSTDLLNPSEALSELTTQDRIKMDSLRARQANRSHSIPPKRIFRHQNR